MVAQLLQIGRRTTTEVRGVHDAAATAEVAEGLGVAPGARVRHAELLRLLGGMPVSHLAAYFPASQASRGITRAVLASRPLLAVTEEIGGPVRDLSQAITCVLADGPLAALLQVEPGAPLVRVERRFLGRRAALQFSLAHYRADCFTIETLERRSGVGRRSEIRMRLAERDGVGD
jgi:GntR family transcriptional regulator